MRRKSIVSWAGVAAAALLLAVAPAGAADTPEPGLWSIATRIGHGERWVPLRKVERCISPDEARVFGSWTSTEWAGKDIACKSSSYRKTDKGGVLQIHCSGNTSIDATATFTLNSPQHYTVVLAATPPSTGPATRVTRKIEGRRIGECAR